MGMSHEEAAAYSGLSTGTVRTLFQDERVKAYVAKIRRARERRLNVTREDVVEGMLGAIERAQQLSEPATEIRGWEAIAKLQGLNAPERHVHELPEETREMLEALRAMDDDTIAKLAGAGAIDLSPEDFQRVEHDGEET